jgi:hypothetical protein
LELLNRTAAIFIGDKMSKFAQNVSYGCQ